MSPQATAVLNEFNKPYNRSYEGIAYDLDIPEASVRRSVQELRRAGKRITRPGGIFGLMKLKRR